MEYYNITGMSCAACSARVERAVSKLPNVDEVSVNLLTNTMSVKGNAKSSDIIAAVEAAGYGASLKNPNNTSLYVSSDDSEALKDTQTPLLKKRLEASLIFLIILMYFSMGHMMLGLPLPSWFKNNHVAMGLVQLLLAGIIMIINQRFFISGTKAILNGSPNMDTLVALGSGVSYIWSIYILFLMTASVVNGDTSATMQYMDEFYFESAAMILTLITVGKMLEARSKGKTTDALKSLMKLSPQTATLFIDNNEKNVPISDVKVDDIFIVKPGELVPVDGTVIYGASAINEAALTGESIPVDKTIGDDVSAATINQSGYIRCRATRVGSDTTLSQIIKMVSDASATKAPIAKIADKVSGIFVPVVICIAIATTIIWLLLGKELAFALARGISVLVISCPCALGLATPVAIMVGSGVGAKNGILFKNAPTLEAAGKVEAVVLDKTGTITNGEPVVTDIYPTGEFNEASLLELAYSLEIKSEHPLAKAIVKKANELNISCFDIDNFSAMPGNGITATYNEIPLLAGSYKYISSIINISADIKSKADELSNQGKTPLIFSKGGNVCGLIAVADTIKPDSKAAIAELKGMGIKVLMLTGDNEKTARAIGSEVGVDDVIAGVLPDGKEAVIKDLMKHYKVAMVGDGINDAPALTRADIGIAIGAGSDIAIDSASIVLMKNSLLDVPAAIRLSRNVLRNIHENLFWAFIYNIIGIPLAAGCYIALGLTLNPMFGAAAMSLSSFSVVSNALRLNLYDIYNSKRDYKIKKKERITMNNSKAIKIEGMMCPHCEARVKKALEELPEISEAIVSHKEGNAIIKLVSDISDDKIKNTIGEQGYKVIDIQ